MRRRASAFLTLALPLSAFGWGGGARTVQSSAVDIARDREGRHLYALNTIEGTVEGYRVGADGRFTSITRAGASPHACLLDPAKPECTKRHP